MTLEVVALGERGGYPDERLAAAVRLIVRARGLRVQRGVGDTRVQ